ncbi:hypothetical protein EYC80_008195 [Monilinia laxa]|uniref:Uncharacterized protein n=1 Tax=Monilinia laxa TaxID=61186 RepID=A0A5N6JVN4_MONLA|nr:hypothetical protein EYC80_008195 [Monilinia laxa]
MISDKKVLSFWRVGIANLGNRRLYAGCVSASIRKYQEILCRVNCRSTIFAPVYHYPISILQIYVQGSIIFTLPSDNAPWVSASP